MSYTSTSFDSESETPSKLAFDPSGRIIAFPSRSYDIAFDDTMVDQVKDVWRILVGEEVKEEEFMNFEDREGTVEQED